MEDPKNVKTNNEKISKSKDMSKSQIQQALIKKKECEARALMVVERLLENPVSMHWFIYCLRFINQSHLEDVFEERFLIKLCGYPICSGVITEVPQQQYVISTKVNKVYDITDRKKFCTNQCYRAAVFIKEQMLTSPLWLRDKEEIPDFKLLPWIPNASAGAEVEFGIPKIEVEPPFTSISDFTSLFLNDVDVDLSDLENTTNPSEFIDDPKISKCQNPNDLKTENKSDISDVTDNVDSSEKKDNIDKNKHQSVKNEEQQNIISELLSNDIKNEAVKQTLNEINEDINDLVEKLKTVAVDKKDDNKVMKVNNVTERSTVNNKIKKGTVLTKPKAVKSQKSLEEITAKINKNKEKKTILIDPLPLPLSKEKEITEKVPIVNEYEKIQEKLLLNLDEIAQITKIQIPDKCAVRLKTKEPVATSRELAIEHVEKCLHEWFTINTYHYIYGDDNLKKIISEKNISVDENFCSTPYIKLEHNKKYQELCKRLNLMELEDNEYDKSVKKIYQKNNLKPVPDYKTLKKQNQKLELKVRSFYDGTLQYKEESSDDSEDETNEETDLNVVTLQPLVDSTSQVALRKRIVHDNLNKTMPGILQTFGLTSHDMSPEIRQLISTFDLNSKNITFKPHHLNLLGLIIIKLLSERNQGLKKLLGENVAIKYTTMLLSIYKLPEDYLNIFLKKLIDNLLS